MREKDDTKRKGIGIARTIEFVLLLAVIVAAVFILCPQLLRDSIGKKEKTTIITSSKLEKVLQISELSTYSITFNGVAAVNDEKERLLYNVAYEAKVNIGLDMNKIRVRVDEANEENKKIIVTLPEIEILEAVVDPGSLEYIFEKNSANTGNVSMTAIPACKADAEEECNSNAVLFELAKENAKNTVTALVEPLLKEYDEYSLEIVGEGGYSYE